MDKPSYTLNKMDIRNINMEEFSSLSQANKGRELELIFKLQKALLDKYVGIEKLPSYPIDINAPSNQVLIKDFIARITEELGEAHESYLWLYHWVLNGMDEAEGETVVQKRFNFNEEIADALHFFVEVFIFTGISAYTINQFISQFNFPEFIPDDLGDTLNYPMDTGMPEDHLSDDVVQVLPSIGILTEGGRFIGDITLRALSIKLWHITYYLQLARNALKNKPWKQSQILSDKKTYQNNMILAFMEFINFCRDVGLTNEAILAIYWAKNQVNEFRISSKY